MFRKIGLLIVSVVLMAGGLLVSVTPATAAEPETEAAQAAVDYIISLQNADGGFPGFGDESSPGVTLDAVFALVAAGVDVESVTADGNSPMDYLATQAAEYAADPGAAAKLALALQLVPGFANRVDDFGGIRVLTSIQEETDLVTGMVGLDTFDHVFMMLWVGAIFDRHDVRLPDEVGYLLSSQLDDGGWEFGEGFESDSNTTAMALQALLGANVATDDPAIVGGLDYLRSIQDASAAFAFLADAEPDAQSTAFVIQALAAAGEDIDAGGPWASGGVTPLEALLTFQNPETGAFQFAGEDSPFATYQVVPGLLLAPFPGLQLMLLPGTGTPAASPTMTVEPVETPGPADLPKVGTGASSDGSPWLPPLLLAAGGLAALGLGAARRRYS